jgi:hypothetical protein
MSDAGTHILLYDEGTDSFSIFDALAGKELKIPIALDKNKLAQITYITFLPSSKEILSVDQSGDIELWDIRSGGKIRTFNKSSELVISRPSNHAFSVDGRYLALTVGGSVQLWDISTGAIVWSPTEPSLAPFDISSVSFSPDGRYIAQLQGGRIKLLDVNTGNVIKVFSETDEKAISIRGDLVKFSPDSKHIIAPDSTLSYLHLWNINEEKRTMLFSGDLSLMTSLAFSPDGKYVVVGGMDGTTRLWDIATGKEIAQFISFTDGEWVVITPEGYFNASPNGAKHLNVRVGNNIYGIDQFYSKFYRPELVKLALAGKEIPKGEMLTDVASQKPAPAVEILSPRSGITVSEDMIKITVKLKDNGGGIGDVNVYLNGSQIANDTRGVVIKGKESSSEKALDFNISLMEGNNDIKIIAFNKEGSMESIPAILSVFSKVVLQKPNLYAIVVGINEYKNKNISLNYAVSDAKAFTETLKATAKTLFENINAKLLISSDETTKESIQKAFEKIRTRVKPNDLFVFYNASHGVIDIVEDQEQYYLLTSNVLLLSSRHIGKDAMSQKELIQLIGAIPAQKKLIILDTCHAGKAGKEITVALLQQTRGLTESTAIKLLQRAVGSTVFSASSDTQQALEGYKGHGLFTYVLNEGLQGKADMNKDGFIKVNELADYVEERVITLSEQVFKRQQTPTNQIGVNFPIGKVK